MNTISWPNKLDHYNMDIVAQISNEIIKAFEPPFCIERNEIFSGISIGISIYPSDGRDLDTLVKNADIAMYRAKENGRNQYQYYSSEMTDKISRRLELEMALRRALEQDQFLLYYQPQVDLQTGEVAGVEALIRWQHPDLGLVPPLEFIEVLEATGLIIPVGEWVLKEACKQCKAWHDLGFEQIRLAVNLSAKQFSDKGLINKIINILLATTYSPKMLELEITESVVMDNPDAAVRQLKDLDHMGIQLSVDDFGTGYSSLAYLKRLPIHELKLDRSFVRDIPADSESSSITKAVIALANTLHLQVVAEGVETQEQLEFLTDEGCDYMQGYYYSRPLPAGELLEFLKQKKKLTTDAIKRQI